MGARDWGGEGEESWGAPSKTSCLYGISDFLGDVGPNRELTSTQVEARKGSPIALSSRFTSTHMARKSLKLTQTLNIVSTAFYIESRRPITMQHENIKNEVVIRGGLGRSRRRR